MNESSQVLSDDDYETLLVNFNPQIRSNLEHADQNTLNLISNCLSRCLTKLSMNKNFQQLLHYISSKIKDYILSFQ